MIVRSANRTAQTGTYRSGPPAYVELSSGAVLSGMRLFADAASADGWTTGDGVSVLVKKDDTHWEVWSALWDSAAGTLTQAVIETAQGTLTDGAVVEVMATVTADSLLSLAQLHASALY